MRSMPSGEAIIVIGGREFKIQKQFLDDINEKNMDKTLKSLKSALLVLHSPQDTTVGIENAAQIFQSAWHSKKLYIVRWCRSFTDK